MSYRIPQLIIYSLNNAVGTASFPALASVQTDKKRLKHYYFNYIRYLSLFVLPIGVGLALTAPTLITVLLSESWTSAILPTALISLALAILSMGYVPGVLYKAIGRPEILNYLVVIKTPIVVSILWLSTRWGIAGVAAGQVANAFILVTIDTLCANYIMKYSVSDLIKAIFPSAVASVIMGGMLILLYWLFTLDGILGLISVVIAGAGVYFAALALISRETILQGFAIVKRSFSGWQPGFNGKA
jgi:PST family polysaccharide transporter